MNDIPAIPTRPLGNTGEQVTIFGLGGEGVLRTYGREAEAAAVIEQALELGVNYFDSAPAYSGCLDYLGASLGVRRQDVFLASKTHDRTRDGSLRLLDDALKRLRTDYLDLWQLHDLRTPADLDRIFAPGGAIEALLAAREDGRVRYLGITGHHDPQILLSAMSRFEFDTALVALNCADRHRLSFIESVLPDAAQRGLGVIAMKVYAQGALLVRGGPTAEEALGYVLDLPVVSTAIIGCCTPQQVAANARIACQWKAGDGQQLASLEQRVAPVAPRATAYKKMTLHSID